MAAPTSMKPWIMLCLFAWTSASNAFMFMNYPAISRLSRSLLHVNGSKLNWLYSIAMMSELPAMVPVSSWIITHHYTTILLGIGCNIIAAWLRYVSVVQESWGIAMVSSVFLGSGAAVICCGYTEISRRYFEPSHRTLATSIGVQSNYAGWALGAFVTPYLVPGDPENPNGPEALRRFLFVQAVVVSLSLVEVLVIQREPPKKPGDVGDSLELSAAAPGWPASAPVGNGTQSLVPKPRRKPSLQPCVAISDTGKSLLALARNTQFQLQMWCFSVLAGISFALAAILDIVMGDLQPGSGTRLYSHEVALCNFIFLASGIFTGLVLGSSVRRPSLFAPVLKTLFVVACVSQTALVVVCYHANWLSHGQLLALICVFIGLAGGGVLGFVGIALSCAAHQAHPVGAAYSGGAVEWLFSVFGVVCTQLGAIKPRPVGLVVLTGASWLATGILFLGLNIRKDPKEERQRHAAMAGSVTKPTLPDGGSAGQLTL